MLEQSLLSAPTREGSPRYLSERASVSLCKVSKISALSKAFVLGGKKYSILLNSPSVQSLYSKYPTLVARKLH
jgi:hypothetical protein